MPPSDDWEDRFPDLKRTRSVPPLVRINGCGFGVYGSRDFDPETGTYVKTYCFCLIFIPVLALSAYRVADASSGWYFLGRVPLSRLAKAWNVLLLAVVLGGAGLVFWQNYTQSPDYIAGRKLAEADGLAAVGEVVRPARVYHDVALGSTGHRSEGLEKFNALLEGAAAQAPLSDAAAVLAQAVDLEQRRPGSVPNLVARGMERARKDADSDPRGALKVLETVGPLARDSKDFTAARQQLLEKLVARQPNDPEPAVQLALLCEARGDLDRCQALLLPHRGQLGTSEGARILGQILAARGKIEEAHALLLPYTQDRLQKLDAAEQAFRAGLTRVENQLDQGQAFDFPYARYRSATPVEQGRIISEYMQARIKEDPDLRRLEEALQEQRPVVSAALDLGVVLLRRAQGIADPAARRAELEKAEKMFLAIQSHAGRSDVYRLHLGQVYYWLGKPTEGRKLFDELLKAEQRSGDALLQVARVLREVGAGSEARPLTEEAYNKESDPKKKYAAAMLRALLGTDRDDKVRWLERADPEALEVQASLASERGRKALEEGKDDEAAKEFRRAAEIYESLHGSAAALNNGALAYFDLYQATGDRKHLDQGVKMLDRAAALDPGNSILLYNVATSIIEVTARDVIGPAIDLNTLRRGGGLDLLEYLYQDQGGRDRLLDRVRRHEGMAKARSYLERRLVLAPRDPNSYSTLALVYRYQKDQKALDGLYQRLLEANLDLSDAVRLAREHYAGKDEDKRRKELQAGLGHQEMVVRAARQGMRGTTLAVAAADLANYKMSMAAYGLEVKPDDIVTLAEEAHAAAPSRATASVLVDALLTRASGVLAKQDPAYASMASRSRRSLTPRDLVAVVLARQGPQAKTALGNEDVRRAVALVRETAAKFPDEHPEWWWALLRSAHPDDAARLAKAILGDRSAALKRSAEDKLSPLSASIAFRRYWVAQMAGKEAEGVEVLKHCAAEKVPLPFDPAP